MKVMRLGDRMSIWSNKEAYFIEFGSVREILLKSLELQGFDDNLKV